MNEMIVGGFFSGLAIYASLMWILGQPNVLIRLFSGFMLIVVMLCVQAIILGFPNQTLDGIENMGYGCFMAFAVSSIALFVKGRLKKS